MPRFVILRHELPPGRDRATHFDLMVEQGEALRTWALDEWPVQGQGAPARSLPDHRLDYLAYEGPVSGDRGAVTRVEQGTCEVAWSSDEAWSLVLHASAWTARLDLQRLAGDRWIVRTTP